MIPGRALATACAALLAIVGCSSDGDANRPTSFDFTEEDLERMRETNARLETTLEQIVTDRTIIDSSPRWRADFESAVLEVRAGGCGPQEAVGSASLIGDRHAVTAAHVVAGADGVVVIDGRGERHRVDVVFFDPELDVAVLRTPADIGEPLGFYDGEIEAGMLGRVSLTRRTDDTVTVETASVEILRHVAIETTDIYRDREVTRPGFEVEANVDPGDSGAVVTVGGAAAGIIWARSIEAPNRAWAVDLPDSIREPTARRALVDAVDVGRCTD